MKIWLLCALLLLTACTPPKKVLRLGISLWPGYELAYLAREKGFYEDENLDIRLIEFSDLADSRRAFEQGLVDGIGLTLTELLEARDDSQRDLRGVNLINASYGGDMMIARPGIRSMSQLQGKTIAIELSSLGIYTLALALERHQISRPKIKVVYLHQYQMKKALYSGQVDAAVVYPPHSAEILRDKNFQIIFSSREIPNTILDLYAFDRAVIEQFPRELQAFIRALDKAYRFYRESPSEACAIMARREGMKAQEFCQALSEDIQLIPPLEQQRYWGPDGTLPALVARATAILRQAGRLSPQSEISQCLMPL
jgi:NitT/TauT family transport system substrate-binding protein